MPPRLNERSELTGEEASLSSDNRLRHGARHRVSADGTECRMTSQAVYFSLPIAFCVGVVGHQSTVGVGTLGGNKSEYSALIAFLIVSTCYSLLKWFLFSK